MTERDAPPSGTAATEASRPSLDATLPDGPGRRPLSTARGTRALDRYQTVALLGEGGMGEVHLCADRTIGRRVAMKRIRREMHASDSAHRRFVREALVQARLEHPAIVPVYDVALEPGGDVWFTMKRVRGQTMEDVIAAHRDEDAEPTFSRRRLLSAFVQLCLAVDYAHDNGVIHRDLKPGNVMLGDFGELHVLDWGLAKVAGESDPGRADEPSDTLRDELAELPAGANTLAGAPMGTPGYMSPEQCRGEHESLDGRTDVFALGAILFEVLTLEPLVGGTSVGERLGATLHGVDARPSSRGVEVPPELERACVEATARDRDERTASARAIAEAVERYLDGDRDLERRRALAEDYVAKAREHVDSADPDTRAEVIRDLGRAVALDPGNDEGLTLLAKEMLEPPEELPPAGQAELRARRDEARREAARTAAQRFAAWMAFLPLVYWMGVRDWSVTLLVTAAIVGCGLFAAYVARKATPDRRVWLGLLGGSSVVLGLMSVAFGSLVMVPTLAATNAMFFGMYGERSQRHLAVVANGLAVLVPLLLELGGVVDPAYAFGEGMLIHERAVHFPPVATLVTLLLTSVASVAIPAALAGRASDALANAEERLFRQAFHLRAMVPSSRE